MSKEVRLRGFLVSFNCSLLILSVLAVSFLISESNFVSSQLQNLPRNFDLGGESGNDKVKFNHKLGTTTEQAKAGAILPTETGGRGWNVGITGESLESIDLQTI